MYVLRTGRGDQEGEIMARKFRLMTSIAGFAALAGTAVAPVSAGAQTAPLAGLALAGGTTYTIKFTSTQSGTTPDGELMYKFQKMVEQGSHGQIKVDVYPNSILGTEDELVPQVISNVAQMTELFAPQMAAYVSTFNFFQVPFIFSSQAQVDKGLQSNAVQALDAQFAKKTGVRVMGWGSLGFVQLLNSVRPVHQPSDLKGLKVRIAPGSVPLQKSLTLLGANPVPLAESDDYTGEQSGLVNAIVNPSYTFLATKDYENLKYLTNLNFQYNPNAILMNQKFFLSLPKNLQSVVQSAVNTTTKQAVSLVNAASKSANAQLEKVGVKVVTATTAQRQMFIKAVDPYLKSTVSTYGAGLFQAFGVKTGSL
jgi:TRAP-type C4-dicarboxylate transport system substrate-binding protein